MSRNEQLRMELGFVPDEEEQKFLREVTSANEINEDTVIRSAVRLLMRIKRGGQGTTFYTREPYCDDEIGYRLPFGINLQARSESAAPDEG